MLILWSILPLMQEEILGEGKDMFCRREENGDGKGENLLEKENVTMADRLTDIVKIGLEFWTQNSKIMCIDRQTKPVSKSQIVKFYIFTLSHSYQIIVADAADAVSVNFSSRCKFLQI